MVKIPESGNYGYMAVPETPGTLLIQSGNTECL